MDSAVSLGSNVSTKNNGEVSKCARLHVQDDARRVCLFEQDEVSEAPMAAVLPPCRLGWLARNENESAPGCVPTNP